MLLFGWIAGILSNIYNVPQIYHTWKIKSSKDLSIISILFRLASYSFYIVHANIIKDPPLLWNTIISFFQVLVIAFQYFFYKYNIDKNEEN
jgi:uncharacterized protein with PQ loop repeat